MHVHRQEWLACWQSLRFTALFHSWKSFLFPASSLPLRFSPPQIFAAMLGGQLAKLTKAGSAEIRHRLEKNMLFMFSYVFICFLFFLPFLKSFFFGLSFCLSMLAKFFVTSRHSFGSSLVTPISLISMEVTKLIWHSQLQHKSNSLNSYELLGFFSYSSVILVRLLVRFL